MLEKISKIQVVLLGLILGISIFTSAMVVSGNISKNEISVTGMAYEIVKSDSAKWTLSFNTEGPTRVAAYKKLTDATPVVKKFLLDNGVKEEEIEIATIDSYINYKINPATGNQTQEIKDYTYIQHISIRSNNVELIKKLQNESQSLVEENITVSESRVEYYYSKMPEKKAALLSAATLDAKNRASGMLKATHNRVGKMRSAKMGVFQITQPESNDVADWGINDTMTIDKKVTAVANVVFGIR